MLATQKFIWKESEPINYNRNLEKWPKTQTIEPLWEVNSGIFLAHRSHLYQRLHQAGWSQSKVSLLYIFGTLLNALAYLLVGIKGIIFTSF